MAENVTKRLNKVLTELNISMDRAVEYLAKKGIQIDPNPNTKLDAHTVEVLEQGFQQDKNKKQLIEEVNQAKREEKEKQRLAKEAAAAAATAETEPTPPAPLQPAPKAPATETAVEKPQEKQDPVLKLKTVGKIDLETLNRPAKKPTQEPKKEEKPAPKVEKTSAPKKEKKQDKPKPAQVPAPAPVVEKKKEEKAPEEKKTEAPVTKIETQYQKLEGIKTLGKIDLSIYDKPKTAPAPKKPVGAVSSDQKKRKRKRGEKVTGQEMNSMPAPEKQNNKTAKEHGGGNNNNNRSHGKNDKKNAPRPAARKVVEHVEPSEEEIARQIRETLDKLTAGKASRNKAAKYRKEKRLSRREEANREAEREAEESRIIKVTEFVTVNEVATMMDVPVTQVISSCMQLGIMASMNQRLDADTLSVVADEFGYEVQFVDAEIEEAIQEVQDDEKDLKRRAPIVTVMGHVDHGKTSLLDYIRRSNVIAGEAGGITQHIAAYGVKLEDGQRITFLDTPGHEAFTAMRARGAQVTDIAIIVIAADSDVMPQTKEAISHAQAAGVPMVIAINKVDLPTANPDKIRESLAQMNILVEEWGGKVQCQEISAKKGIAVNELLEKVLLEAEMLDLKANPSRKAVGTVIEASLDKGRGYQATVLVQNGTLRVGDYALSGQYTGKVKAMFDERGNKLEKAVPSQPVLVLGLDGSPQAGDKFMIFEDEKEAKQIAARRTQLKREQNVRTSKHITLDEIGRRIAIGDFKELNIIIKGDVDGSVEALTDSLERLSTDKIHINIIHRAVGAITESDVLLASASEAIIIGFNVRPAAGARRIAESEAIDIRTYSIIYDAINEVKDAMEGLLAPEFKEEVVGNVEIRQVYKISKVGSVAGCMVTDGKITRQSKIRVIRDGVVVHTGELESLKRYKDDVKEVTKGYECGLSVAKYNDIMEGDVIEVYQMVEVKAKL